MDRKGTDDSVAKAFMKDIASLSEEAQGTLMQPVCSPCLPDVSTHTAGGGPSPALPSSLQPQESPPIYTSPAALQGLMSASCAPPWLAFSMVGATVFCAELS